MSLTSNEKLERAISRLPRVDTFPFRSALYDTYSPQDAFSGLTGANVLLALHRAREARELAVSYRDFNVGAAVMYFCFEPAIMQMVSGINIKPESESVINVHAKQLALQKLKDRGASIISLIAVVGELQADTQSGMLAETLHPCGLCRDKLSESGYVNPTKTLVVSALPDLRTLEFYTFKALSEFHTDGYRDNILSVKLPEMELLTPFEPKSQEPYKLVDTPEIQAEEDIWEQNVEMPLLHYRLTGEWPLAI